MAVVFRLFFFYFAPFRIFGFILDLGRTASLRCDSVEFFASSVFMRDFDKSAYIDSLFPWRVSLSRFDYSKSWIGELKCRRSDMLLFLGYFLVVSVHCGLSTTARLQVSLLKLFISSALSPYFVNPWHLILLSFSSS